jgi:hypothetical protein
VSASPAGPAPAGPAAPSPASGVDRFRSFWTRTWAKWLPKTSDRPRRPDGLQSVPGPDRLALLMAFLIAAVAALGYELFAAVAPIPPGGDEGSWLLLSYAYVGLPTTTQAIPLGYPPLSFPVLGVAVLLGGGPLAGARIYAGLVIALLGLSFYSMSRAMFQLRSIALLMEGAFFVQPDFQQLYYFGSFPNMLGLVFFFLSVSYGLRYLRSRRPVHLAIFWTATTAAVLSHALVAVLLIGTLGVAMVLLFVLQRLPRDFFFSRTGVLGLLGFVGSSVAYYVGAVVAGLNTPNYLSTGPLTYTKSTVAFPVVLKPLYLQNLAQVFRGSGFTMSPTLALQVAWEIEIGILVVLVVARLLLPRFLTYRVVLIASWFVAIFAVALVTWYLGLTADYRRFAYFLYPATILGAGLVFDVLAVQLYRRLSPPVVQPGGTVAVRSRTAPPWRWRRWDRSQVAVATVFAVTAVVLILAADQYTVPNAQQFAKFFTLVGHDQTFIDAMSAISRSGIPGAILSVTPVVDRWPSTLTTRNLYESRPPTGYTYSSANLVQDEQAFLASNYRYAVTNGQVAAVIPGTTPLFYNASPTYEVYAVGILRPLIQLAPQNIFVGIGSSSVPVYVKSTPVTPQFLLPTSSGTPAMAIRYTGAGFVLTETITATPGTSQVVIVLNATPTGPTNLTSLRLKLTPGTSNLNFPSTSSNTSFGWFANTTNGNFTTAGSLGGRTQVLALTPNVNDPNASAAVSLVSNATSGTGNGSLALSFTLDTPGTSNPAPGMTGFYSAPALWSLWSVRFVLLWNGTVASGIGAEAYFVNEYGTSQFFAEGDWIILLVPAPST